MEFYNPNEKIKQMRKKFRVNQADLECVNMTRAFISMMESGKRKVSKASSQKLAEKFREIASKISLKIEIDDEYFCREPKDDARYYCENELLNTDKLRHKDIEELLKIEKTFELDDLMARTYKVNADKYFNENDIKMCFENLSESLGKYKELKDNRSQGIVYNSMGACKMRKNEYDEAIFYFKQAINYSSEEGDKITFYKSSHSLGLAYARIEANDKCIDILEKNILSNKEEVEESLVINSEIIIANVLYQTSNKKHLAINKYLNIIQKIGNTDPIALGYLYNNLAEYYYTNKNYASSMEYIKEAQIIKSKYNKAALANTLNIKAKILFEQGLLDESIMLFELAIDLAQSYKQYDMLYENYKDLAEILEGTNNFEMLRKSLERFLEILENNDISIGKSYAIYKLAKVAAKQGNNEYSMKLLDQLEPLIVKEN